MKRLPRKLKKRFKRTGIALGMGIEMQIRYAKYTESINNKFTIKDLEDMLHALENRYYGIK